MGFLDLPDQPDPPGRTERAGVSGADRPTPRRGELPDPDERGRAYEVMRAHFRGNHRNRKLVKSAELDWAAWLVRVASWLNRA